MPIRDIYHHENIQIQKRELDKTPMRKTEKGVLAAEHVALALRVRREHLKGTVAAHVMETLQLALT